MKKLLLCTFILLTSLSAQAADTTESSEMKCAFSIEELTQIQDEIGSFPNGLWFGENENIFSSLHFYIDQNDNISLFRTAKTEMGEFADNSKIGICAYKKRSFITSEEEYFEYYMDGKKLKLARDDFDVDFPEDRSEFEFDTVRPAKVVVK